MKRRELKAIENQKTTAEKALVEKLTHKKMKKTQKQIKNLEILKDEISDDDEEDVVVEKKAPKKAVAKKVVEKTPKTVAPKKAVKKTKKVVYESESESESESEDEAPVRRKSAVKQKVITHPSCVFI